MSVHAKTTVLSRADCGDPGLPGSALVESYEVQLKLPRHHCRSLYSSRILLPLYSRPPDLSNRRTIHYLTFRDLKTSDMGCCCCCPSQSTYENVSEYARPHGTNASESRTLGTAGASTDTTPREAASRAAAERAEKNKLRNGGGKSGRQLLKEQAAEQRAQRDAPPIYE